MAVGGDYALVGAYGDDDSGEAAQVLAPTCSGGMALSGFQRRAPTRRRRRSR
ncbi:MAG: hypothetical protein MZU95_06535 [Desulfomicrobium escambiense]|nr:hypothetical protein [Desulfomicrobium escambiense]